MRAMPARMLPSCLSVLLAALGAHAGAAEGKIALEISRAKVARYDKVEFLIHIDKAYENPFDPQQVDLAVLLTAPSGKRLSVPAFYYQDYQRRRIEMRGKPSDWLYPAGPPTWRARFAPVEIGTYRAVARLKDRHTAAQSDTVRFASTPSQHNGFVQISKQDPRFLELSGGKPLFLIGQNLAFIGPGQTVNLARAEEIFAELADNGANFLRIWTCCKDWALAIEARKSAWGRSWSWKPPIVPMPGREDDPAAPKCVKLASGDRATLTVSPSHPLAVRPETRYVIAGKVRTDGRAKLQLLAGNAALGEAVASAGANGWTEFRREFVAPAGQLWLNRLLLRLEGNGTAWLAGLSLKEADGGPELLWEADVNRPLLGRYNPVDCFMLDQLVEAARRRGIYLQLCIITRDLYMKSLQDDRSAEYVQAVRHAKNLMRFAVARWGYSTSVAAWEYFNEMDPRLPTDRFYGEMGEYLREIDVYHHLRVTSTWSASPKDWRHAELDVAQGHHYLRPEGNQRFRDEVAAVVEQTALLRKHAADKPVLLAEFGLAENNWQRSQYMARDEQLVHFHNSLWSSALSGASGTALFWWWEQLDKQDAYGHYRPLGAFLEDVPFTTVGFRQASATVSVGQVRALGLQGRQCGYLWLFNSQATWWNQVVEKKTPAAIRDAVLEVARLAPGEYRVLWWDTREGKVVKEEQGSPVAGTLRLEVPSFDRDIACKIVR